MKEIIPTPLVAAILVVIAVIVASKLRKMKMANAEKEIRTTKKLVEMYLPRDEPNIIVLIYLIEDMKEHFYQCVHFELLTALEPIQGTGSTIEEAMNSEATKKLGDLRYLLSLNYIPLCAKYETHCGQATITHLYVHGENQDATAGPTVWQYKHGDIPNKDGITLSWGVNRLMNLYAWLYYK